MAINWHLTLEPGQWWGACPAQPGGRLVLQIARLGEPQDGWAEVKLGWRYDNDTDIRPAAGVWVATDALPGSA